MRAAAIIFAIGVAMLVAACKPSAGTDGHRFDGAEWSNSQLRITLVLHPSVEDLEREGKRSGALALVDEAIQAWSVIDAHGNCVIHIVDPAKRYMPEFAGHELMHCAFGRFHGKPVT